MIRRDRDCAHAFVMLLLAVVVLLFSVNDIRKKWDIVSRYNIFTFYLYHATPTLRYIWAWLIRLVFCRWFGHWSTPITCISFMIPATHVAKCTCRVCSAVGVVENQGPVVWYDTSDDGSWKEIT